MTEKNNSTGFEWLDKVRPEHLIKPKRVNRMKATRFKMGYSQGEMAELLGVTQATYNRIENEKARTSDAMLEKIAKQLHLKKSDLFKKARVD